MQLELVKELFHWLVAGEEEVVEELTHHFLSWMKMCQHVTVEQD